MSLALSTYISSSQHPTDVRLVFPLGRELWASSKILSQASPYFNTMFSSTLVLKVGTKRNNPTQLSPTSLLDFDDSDAEDEVQDSPHEPVCDDSYYRVEITSASYKTYLAALCRILSKKVVFASLKSSATVPKKQHD